MKKNNHKIAGSLCIACALALCACGAPAPTPEDPAEDLVVVGFSQTGAESDWRVANSESVKANLTEENGYELLFSDAQQRQENQIRTIRRFIQQQVDYIVFSPLTETGWDAVLQETREAGIPVIVTDRQIVVEDASLYTAYIGSDFRAESDAAMRWLAQKLEIQGRDQDPITLVELQGTPGSTPQLGRTAGLEAAVARHPNWTLTGQYDAEFTAAKAKEVAAQVVREAGAPTVFVCQNDNMALGVIDTLNAAGIPCGTGPSEVIIISFDATNAGLTACLAGDIAYDAECNPIQGPYLRELLDTLEQGATPPKYTYVEESAFTTDTLTQNIIDARAY